MKKNAYHYTFSGLNNIYLLNGYEIIHTEYGDTLSIQDVDGLHRMISDTLINKPRRLLPAEYRFLRKEMKLSQVMLGQMLGVTDQTVARIEKGDTEASVPYEATFRALANEIICKQRSEITAIINEINVRNDAKNHDLLLKIDNNKWERKAV